MKPSLYAAFYSKGSWEQQDSLALLAGEADGVGAH